MPDQQFTQAISLFNAGQAEQAEQLCVKALSADGNDINMLGLLGLIQMKTGRLELAESTLKKSIALEPRFAKPHEDLASLYMHSKQAVKAEPLFRRVTELEPQSSSAWLGLAHALKAMNRTEEANTALQRSAELSPVKQLLDRAEQFRKQGELAKARSICVEILHSAPRNISALRQLAIIATMQGNAVETEQHLLKVVEVAPNAPAPLNELARFYGDNQRYMESLNCLKRAAILDPTDSVTQLALAESLYMFGLADQALQAYEKVQAMDSASSNDHIRHIGHIGKADTLRAIGRTEEAISSYQHCIKNKVDAAHAWWSLSSLRTYAFSETEIQEMRSLRQAKSSNEADKIFLDFALGKALDDRQQYDEAWSFYSQGNAARRAAVYYDGATTESEFNSIIDVSQSFKVNLPELAPDTVTPIFILGMPRSGSTLLEQILVSHSEVESTTELPYMLSLGKHHLIKPSGGGLPSITTLSSEHLVKLRNDYLQASQLHRSQGNAYFIDKMPDNFQLVGLIALLFPHAKIIDARRHPLDSCVANYRQLFIKGKDFSYDLFEMGNYYLQYLRIMDHWDELLPGRVLHVQYEKLVNNTEEEIARLLSFCGLQWQENCLNFHRTKRTISSASSEQVRLPIYNTAVGFWQNYQSNLADLMDLLEPALDVDK